MRIAISGCAGTGKTSLAEALAARLGLPLVAEQYETLFRDGGLKSNPEALATRFETVLSAKQAGEQTTDAVADRCGADLLNLWLAHQLHRLPDRTRAFAARCRESTVRFDLVIFPPWGELPLRPHDATDGRVRVQDPWVQLRNHAAILGLASQWLAPTRVIQMPPALGGVAQRADWVVSLIEARR